MMRHEKKRWGRVIKKEHDVWRIYRRMRRNEEILIIQEDEAERWFINIWQKYDARW